MSQSLRTLGCFRRFESAAQHQSFTTTAEELGVTKSAVSRQFRLLESRLGCRLFDRNPRGISLTDDGCELLPQITRAIETLRLATQPYASHQTCLLTVATSVSIAQWYLAPRVNHFMAAWPQLNVRLLAAVWPDALADSTDVQIRFGADEGQPALGRHRLVWVAAPGLVAAEQLPLSDAAFQCFLLIQAMGTSDSWVNYAQRFELGSNHSSTLSVDSHGLAVDLARSGSGNALTGELIAMPVLVSGGLVKVSPVTPGAVDGYYVSVLTSQNLKHADQFVTWLQTQVKEITPTNFHHQAAEICHRS